jgi:hypothetical protein
MIIRPARPEDTAAIWSIIGPVIRSSETYTRAPEMSERKAHGYVDALAMYRHLPGRH